jgi:hypothetical protein
LLAEFDVRFDFIKCTELIVQNAIQNVKPHPIVYVAAPKRSLHVAAFQAGR